jgi:hypothetical protein
MRRVIFGGESIADPSCEARSICGCVAFVASVVVEA